MEGGFDSEAAREQRTNEIDMRALWAVLVRKRMFIILPTCAALLLTWLIVSLIPPRYTAESQVLLENQENFFTRPQKDPSVNEASVPVDTEAVGSQVQLLTSRDLARRAIKALGLEGNAEFDPVAKGIGPVSRVLILLGVMRDPTSLPPEERILQTFQERLLVFSPTKTRVLTIDFQSRDPELAARAANKIAELYLAEQSDAKRSRAKAAAASLSDQIKDLRNKLSNASAQVEEFRSNSGLLAGSNNMTITGQQLAELNTELSKARTSQADAQAKATLIRDMIKQGRISDVPDVVNNDLVRRIAEQRVTARAQLALESRTLLSGHPRIKELTAQLADLDSALRSTAEQTVHGLENEARVAANRVTNLETVLNQQKKVAGVANSDEVHLRELERMADAYKDQLESSSTKYQEALAREDSSATPADARIISRAVVPTDPSYPKKVPIVVFATLATFLGTSGFIIAGELMSGRAIANRARFGVVPRPARVRLTRASVEPAVDVPVLHAPVSDAAVRELRAVDPAPMEKVEPALVQDDRKERIARIAATTARQIVAKRRSDGGTCVLMSGLTRSDVAAGFEVALGRKLAETAHAIILDLDGDPAGFAPLLATWPGQDRTRGDLTGLSELLSGEASFAEVIRRDENSRLHFIPAGLGGSFDLTEFDLLLAPLAETYDFVLLLAPPAERNETAVILAPLADVVLVSSSLAAPEKAVEFKTDLLDAGAVSVIVVEVPSAIASARQDVA